jgi:hypothetical protein
MPTAVMLSVASNSAPVVARASHDAVPVMVKLGPSLALLAGDVIFTFAKRTPLRRGFASAALLLVVSVLLAMIVSPCFCVVVRATVALQACPVTLV